MKTRAEWDHSSTLWLTVVEVTGRVFSSVLSHFGSIAPSGPVNQMRKLTQRFPSLLHSRNPGRSVNQ